MIGGLLILAVWAGAGGLAYWQLGTKADKLKKIDPALYETVKDLKEADLKTKMEEEITRAKQEKANYEKNNKDVDEVIKKGAGKEEGTSEEKQQAADYKTALTTKKSNEEKIAKHEEEITLYETIKEKGVEGYDWSLYNMAWAGGVFLVVGIIGHIIVKQINRMFFSENNKE